MTAISTVTNERHITNIHSRANIAILNPYKPPSCASREFLTYLRHRALRHVLSQIETQTLSGSVLIDGNISNGPGLAAVGDDQAARGAVQRQGVLVVRSSGAHREFGVDLVVYGLGAAIRLLAVGTRKPCRSHKPRSGVWVHPFSCSFTGTPWRSPGPDHHGRWLCWEDPHQENKHLWKNGGDTYSWTGSIQRCRSQHRLVCPADGGVVLSS